MSITVATEAGNAVLSVDGGNPALILYPTGAVHVGVDPGVEAAAAQQLVGAQSVIDYVQTHNYPAATYAALPYVAPSTPTGSEVNVPITWRRITITFKNVQYTSTLNNNKRLFVGYGTNYTAGLTAPTGSGSIAQIGTGNQSWAAGAQLTGTAPVSTSIMHGVAVFERISNTDASEMPFIFSSQTAFSNTAAVCVSSGQGVFHGASSADIHTLWVSIRPEGGYPFSISGDMYVVVES